MGHGRQTIADAVPFSRIVTQLEFFRPFKGLNMAEFLFEPVDGGTQVRWVMYGPLNFIVRVLCFKMDKMIRRDFETGLKSLKAVAEQTRAEL